MLFRPPKTETFWALTRTGYTDENGRRITGQFDVQFKRGSTAQAIESYERHKKTSDFTDRDFVVEWATGWRGVQVEAPDGEQQFEVGEGGGTVFSEPALRRMCDLGYAGDMAKAFWENLPGAKAKN